MTLDGPFPVFVVAPDGTLTTELATGVHYKSDSVVTALEPYVVVPSQPLQSVWAGDTPEAPQWTVSLRFPNQATADTVLASL